MGTALQQQQSSSSSSISSFDSTGLFEL